MKAHFNKHWQNTFINAGYAYSYIIITKQTKYGKVICDVYNAQHRKVYGSFTADKDYIIGLTNAEEDFKQ